MPVVTVDLTVFRPSPPNERFGGKGTEMTATLDDVTRKIKGKPTGEEQAADEMVRRAREQSLSLTGPDGLLKQLTKTMLETALSQELTERLGHEKNGSPDPATGNVRNATRPKAVLTESSGQMQTDVPRDRARNVRAAAVGLQPDALAKAPCPRRHRNG